MQPSIASPFRISDFLEWDASRQLILTPKFQRRDVWIPTAKSYLIDTILRAMPIPPIFIRLMVDPVQRRSIREVIDGQQRLRTVLSYIAGEFPLLKAHNREFADMTYVDLPDSVQRDFLGYSFLVHTFQDISDGDVLSIFARMNTYTMKLVAQELRNAKFFGPFKETVYSLAHSHNAFWRNNKILTDARISRMADAELVSELVVTMLNNFVATKSKYLSDIYEQYDDVFPYEDNVIEQFNNVIDIIGNIFPGYEMRSSSFRRIPLFFSLFCAIYDGKYGLPKSNRPRQKFSSRQNIIIFEKLQKLENVFALKDPPKKYIKFIEATRLSTADVGKRVIRHNFIWDEILV